MPTDERDSTAEDAILDHNIKRLLQSAKDRPVPSPEARARMLGHLREQAQTQAGPREPAQPGPRTPASDEPQPARVLVLPRRRTGLVAVAVALAALFVLAWALGLFARVIDGPPGGPELAELQHREPGAKAITLADGSTALLRSGAALEQLGPHHLRLVTGEILLDTAAAAEPMLVETAGGQALVRGAQVLLRSGPQQTLAAVLRGTATLEPQAQAQSGATGLLLRAGEQAMLRVAAAPERIAGRRLTHEIDWARELLSPTELPDALRRGNLLARVPRWTGQLGPSPDWPLATRALTVDVHIEDGHVRTTIDQTFFNHLERDLEGVYSFPLPPRAAIARLAMYVDGQRMEAGVVARDRGRDIYEQIVHRRRDPALLEWLQGNTFRVRVFPLPARTEKRILLSYTSSLDELYGRAQLRVPIPELDLPVDQVRYRVRVVGGAGMALEAQGQGFEVRDEGPDRVAEFVASQHRVGADLVVALEPAGHDTALDTGHDTALIEVHQAIQASGPQAGARYLGVRLRPDLRAELEALAGSGTRAPARDWIVIHDSSASRGPAELEAQRRFLAALINQIDPGDRVGVLRFDSALEWLTPGVGARTELDPDAITAALEASRIGVGATELGEALDASLASLAALRGPDADGRERVATLVYLGDGLVNELDAPEAAANPVTTLAARVRDASPTQFIAVSFGPSYDAAALDQLAAAGAGLHVHIDEGESLPWRARELLATLATPRVLGLEARLLDGAGQAFDGISVHASARGLADGESLELLARLPAAAPNVDRDPAAVELSGEVDGQTWSKRFELPEPPGSSVPASKDAGWLPRAWAQAEVAAASEAGVEANAAHITELGLEHFLVTPTTSLLVLERESMYRNFDVRRPPADAWARYEAPEQIEVVREGSSALASAGHYIVRTPIELLGSQDWGQVVTRGFRRGGQGESLGVFGTGRGGGGVGGVSLGFGLGLAPAGASDWSDSFGVDETGGPSVAGFGGRGRRTSAGPAFKGFVRGPTASLSFGANLQQPGQLRSLAPLDQLGAQTRFANVVSTGASLHAQTPYTTRPWPVARSSAWDPKLDDLGELIPALFEDTADLAREQLLLTGLDGRVGEVSEAAAELLNQARAAQADVRYALPEGGTLDIDSQGRFAVNSRRFGFLDERVIYDGEVLRADYPEFELSVRRDIGPTSPAALSSWVPWLVPPVEHLARFYRVERSGPRTVTLRPIQDQDQDQDHATSTRRLEVEFDAKFRVIALRTFVGRDLAPVSETRFTWTEAGLILDPEGEARELRRLGPAQAFDLGPSLATEVALPLPSPSELEQTLTTLEPGSRPWVAIQDQRLASLAALAAHHEQFEVLAELHAATGVVQTGELVLGGAALHGADLRLRQQMLESNPGPVARLLAASTRGRSGAGELGRLAQAEDLRGTAVGFLASYRSLLHRAETRADASTLKALETFLDTYEHPNYAYVATYQLANRWWSQPDRAIQAWDHLAARARPFEQVARYQAALIAYQRGRTTEAGDRFVAAFESAARAQTLPIVDWSVQGAVTEARGQAGWQLIWTQLRERVSTGGPRSPRGPDPALVLGFVRVAQQLGQVADASQVLTRLDPSRLDAQTALLSFDMLLDAGLTREAGQLLDALRAQPSLRESAALLIRAARLAERQGRLDHAALALERALSLELDASGLDLAQLRAGFSQLFDLRARLAQPLGQDRDQDHDNSEDALARALAVADRWRLEDPDNPMIDQRCAELLWSLGDQERAWRQLASIVDRHPAEGEALAFVADALEHGGDLARADLVWARAIAMEPTDPGHRLRRAQNLLANGRRAEAVALLDEIVNGEWQPRFGFLVDQARRLRPVAAAGP